MISVITISNRPDKLLLNTYCLKNQTLTKYEWIICGPESMRDSVPPEAIFVPEPEKLDNDVWNYNKAFNEAIRHAAGTILVFYQDSIWIPPDALDKLNYWLQKKGESWCVTGVGDIYASLDKYHRPVDKCWSDPRKKSEKSAYECEPVDWEMNVAACYKSAVYSIGGASELLDQYFGMDNVSICDRLDMLGYRFWLDQSLEIRGLFHERSEKWDTLHAMHRGYAEISKLYKERKQWPIHPYLTKSQ